MTELERLRAQLNQIVDAIIIEAAKQGSSGSSGTSVPKIDLNTQINSTFDNLIKDKKEKNIMTPYANPYNWPRNNNCWVKSIDLTGYAACNVPLGGVGGGTLITKKHVLLANHVPYAAVPFMIFFVNNNNLSIVYNVVKTRRVANTDILIGELDKEVDASLKVCSVLPSNYLKYFNKNASFPVLHSDQERKGLIANYGTMENVDGCNCVTVMPPTDSNRLQYYEQVIGGDSGNPVFTLINNEAVLLGGWYKQWYGGGGLCTSIPNYITEINLILSESGMKLKEVDLSGFATYS
jgi:hypothetical protein